MAYDLIMGLIYYKGMDWDRPVELMVSCSLNPCWLLKGKEPAMTQRLYQLINAGVWLLVGLYLSGCASVDLGSMDPLSRTEVDDTNCSVIQTEITKTDEFCAQAIAVGFNRRDCAMEVATAYVPYVGGLLVVQSQQKKADAHRALRTATVRQSQLRRLAKLRNCSVSTSSQCPVICEDPEFGWTKPVSVTQPVSVSSRVDDGFCGMRCVKLNARELRLIEAIDESH